MKKKPSPRKGTPPVPTAFGRINECVKAHGVQGTLVALSQHLNLEKGGPHARRLADTLDRFDQSAKEVDKEAHRAKKETQPIP